MGKTGLEKEDARDGKRWQWVVGEAKYQTWYKYPGGYVGM